MVEEPQRDLTFPGRHDSGRKREDEPRIASTSLTELQKRKKIAPKRAIYDILKFAKK